MEELIFYLGIAIRQMNSDKFVVIDEFYNEIRELAIDFKKGDNYNMSLLDSVNYYIDNNKEKINKIVDKCFEK